MYLNHLGISFFSRFERSEIVTDIEKSILAKQQAVDLTPDGHADKPMYLNNLGISLLWQFERHGVVADLDKSILVNQQAVDLTPDGHVNKPIYLNSLGISLLSRFERLGVVADVDNSITANQQAVDLTPDSHANKPVYLNSLGISLCRRSERFEEGTDINNSTLAFQQAVNLTPDGHAKKPKRLSSLGNSLLTRFEMFGEVTDIDKSILAQQQAIDLTPNGHADKPIYLYNLGNSLLSRFERSGVVADIDKSILVGQQAVDLTPNNHAKKPMRLINLGDSYSKRFHVSKEIADIDNAILLQQQAIRLMPDASTRKSLYLSNLGHSLANRFYRTSIVDDLQDSLSSFYDSATSPYGPPHHRLYAARQWASLAANHAPYDNRFMPLKACHILISLVPYVVWLGNSVSLRYHDIAKVGNTVNMAASIACQYGQPDLALEWLEQGRSIVWGQVLHLRTPMNNLERNHPDLAASLDRISSQLRALDASATSLGPSDTTALTTNEGLEMTAQRYRRLIEEWEATLSTVRQCQGYERFLFPMKLDELAPAAALGPVVYINIDERRCDAIILQYINRKPKVDHLHLSLTSQEKIKKLYSIFSNALTGRGARWSSDSTYPQSGEIVSEKDLRFSISADDDIDQVLAEMNDKTTVHSRRMQRVLQMLWTDIVEPIFCMLGYFDTVCSLSPTDFSFHIFHFCLQNAAVPKILPHVTWCTTGPLSFLPLHAAGSYQHDGSTSEAKAYKYAVSSYTPSLSMLLGLEKDTYSQDFLGLAAISQPSTPGQKSLPDTVTEVEKIKDRFTAGEFAWLNDTKAIRDAVLQQMKERSWIHLACHGVQHKDDPMQSAFMLQDGPLDLRTISQQELPHARLAFLSACQTAKGDLKLPQESAHLAAGMLMVGYHTVIGTMWSIEDRDAPIVAEKFYEYLKRGGLKTNDGQAAYALHEAVGVLRERVGEENFLSWVPFIHLGI
jgi:hypothetical protein